MDAVVTGHTDGAQVLRVFVPKPDVRPVVNLAGTVLAADLAPPIDAFEMGISRLLPLRRSDIVEVSFRRHLGDGPSHCPDLELHSGVSPTCEQM
jgi:hypothetical protein